MFDRLYKLVENHETENETPLIIGGVWMNTCGGKYIDVESATAGAEILMDNDDLIEYLHKAGEGVLEEVKGVLEKRTMTYYIALINTNGEEWTLYQSDEVEKAVDFFRDMAIPPEYKYKELRQTEEPLDTCMDYETILRKAL